MTRAITDDVIDSSPAPSLSPDEAAQFHRDGYLGPFAAMSSEDMAELRPAIEAVIASDPPDHNQRDHNRHRDSRLIHDLATHPAIVNRMTGIMGPDLLLWRTNFFVKSPGAKEIPWHQDYNYWPLEPAVIISAWLAIDPATVANSCLQVIPGSHKRLLPHVKSTDDMQFGQMADPRRVDHSNAVNLEMQPGEFVLFNERMAHHSERNRSDQRRIGLSIRVIPPIVRVLKSDGPQHKMTVISGRDTMGFNALTGPPATTGTRPNTAGRV